MLLKATTVSNYWNARTPITGVINHYGGDQTQKRKREENKRSYERCPDKGQNKTLSAKQGIAAHYSMHESAMKTKIKLLW